jgi:hypothetical protein
LNIAGYTLILHTPRDNSKKTTTTKDKNLKAGKRILFALQKLSFST